MKTRGFVALVLSACISGLSGCEDPSATAAEQGSSRGKVEENIDANEKAAAAKLQPAKDPILEEIYTFREQTRQTLNNRGFDELEKRAAEARTTKAVYGNGSWKTAEFYESLTCGSNEPERIWEFLDRIHQDWIKAKPQSVAARVAYAGFLGDYAWHARGSDYADTVTETGWRLFGQRLEAAGKVLRDARALPEKDPYWWCVALRVALGQGWPKAQYDALLAEAKSFEPTFWKYDNLRAYSLLPRWYGEPGEWEDFAEQASARPDGLGAEAYARIVINLRGFHDNIFRESNASWPKVREGLEQMRKKYPNSLEAVSATAMLATMAQDRELAKEMFNRLGDTYLPNIWRKPERFVHYRTWAQTGKW